MYQARTALVISIIIPRDPLPLKGFINAIGNAGTKSVLNPIAANNELNPWII